MPLLHSLQSSIRQLIDISVNACGRNGVVKAGILNTSYIEHVFSDKGQAYIDADKHIRKHDKI